MHMYEEIIIRDLENMNESDAREYIKVLLAGYEKRKSEGKMYDSISLPRVIIMTYYSCIKNHCQALFHSKPVKHYRLSLPGAQLVFRPV